MIKINLANAIFKKAEKQPTAASLDEKRVLYQSIFKGALIVVPLIGLIYVEKIFLDQKKATLAQLNAEKSRLTDEITGKGSVDEIVKQIEEQQKEMDGQIQVIENIFSLRNKKIEILSGLQKHMLPSLWLSQIQLLEKIEEGKPTKVLVTVDGFGSNSDDIQIYTTVLSQEKNYIEKVMAPNISAQTFSSQEVKKFTFDMLLRDK